MKNFKKRFTLLFATVFTCFAFYVSPVMVTAQETSENSTYSAEISQETETDEETPVDSSTSENSKENGAGDSAEEEKEKPTLEDVLDFAEKEAEKAGLGEEWRKALANIKNAVSEKKIDLMTIVDFLTLIAMVAYFIYKIVSNAKLKKVAANLSVINQNEITNGKTLQAQTKTLQNVSEDEEKILEKEKNITSALMYTNDALLQIVEGIKFTPERKEAAIRALNKSNAALDGGKKDDNKTL